MRIDEAAHDLRQLAVRLRYFERDDQQRQREAEHGIAEAFQS
jgi:hypothetical protein